MHCGICEMGVLIYCSLIGKIKIKTTPFPSEPSLTCTYTRYLDISLYKQYINISIVIQGSITNKENLIQIYQLNTKR